MSYARITVAGQTFSHDNVTGIGSEHDYLVLDLAAHPHRVYYWRGRGSRTTVLLCRDTNALIEQLREELR